MHYSRVKINISGAESHQRSGLTEALLLSRSASPQKRPPSSASNAASRPTAACTPRLAKVAPAAGAVVRQKSRRSGGQVEHEPCRDAAGQYLVEASVDVVELAGLVDDLCAADLLQPERLGQVVSGSYE